MTQDQKIEDIMLQLTVTQLLSLQSSHAMFVNNDGKIVELCPSMRILFGEQADQSIGSSLYELARSDFQQNIKEYFEKEIALNSQNSSALPIVLNIKFVDFPMFISSCQLPTGTCKGFIVHTGGFGAIIASQAWQEALNMGKMGIWMYRHDIGHYFQSPSWWQMRGYDLDNKPKFRENEWMDRLHPDDREKFAADRRIEWGGNGKTPTKIQYRQRKKNGNWIWILARGLVTSWDIHGNPLTVVGIDTDITEHVEAAKLRDENALELSHAQRMQSIGQLAGGIAHDFNNILAVILGNTEILASDMPHVNERFNNIFASVHRGAELTKSLLAFSRKQPLHPKILHSRRILDSLKAMLRPTLEINISLELRCEDDTWNCMADKVQLENALLNLALNARDAMTEGGKLTIVAKNVVLKDISECRTKRLEPGQYVAFEVCDTGEGMRPETMERAFEPFFTTKAPGKGTGLGLSMVFGFTKQSNGHAEIESESGVGTCIRLYLPRNQKQPDDGNDVIQSLETPLGTNQRIMIVEDDPLMGELIEQFLEICDYSVALFKNAEHALVAFSDDDNIDLLLTDISLPGESGLLLSKKLIKKKSDIKVLYMSGYSEDIASGSEMFEGNFEYLEKPFSLHTLKQKIEYLLGPELTDPNVSPNLIPSHSPQVTPGSS